MGRASSKVLPEEDDDGASVESAKWTKSSFAMTWKASEELVKKMGGRLLTLGEARSFVKKKGALFPAEDQWAAVMCENGERDWVQVGDKSHEQGTSQLELGEYPSWGDDGSKEWTQAILWVPEEVPKRSKERGEAAPSAASAAAKELNDANAEKEKRVPRNEDEDGKQRHAVVLWKTVKWDTVEESLSWSKAEQYAGTKEGRLLSLEEAKEFLQKHGPIFPSENQWAAVGSSIDRKRDFVQIGDQSHSAGMSHVRDFKQFPWWGDCDHGRIPWMKVVLWTQVSCSRVEPGATVESSEAFAQKSSGELLTLEEARAFLESSGVPFNGEEQWAVVKTSKGHDWVQVGNRGEQPGKSHQEEYGRPPPWEE
ncbi:Hypothetical protein SCF082_LOCUS6638 [Durusdinium trenchii]|uniref:Uncharacterized protein n=1 Tax=Durusdinium trenchii TaxID=1381693 RepID=A0ABP0IDV8_9DINO